MNLQSYITAIENTNDVDTLKTLWWTIGMDTNIDYDPDWEINDLYYLQQKLMERYNQIN